MNDFLSNLLSRGKNDPLKELNERERGRSSASRFDEEDEIDEHQDEVDEVDRVGEIDKGRSRPSEHEVNLAKQQARQSDDISDKQKFLDLIKGKEQKEEVEVSEQDIPPVVPNVGQPEELYSEPIEITGEQPLSRADQLAEAQQRDRMDTLVNDLAKAGTTIGAGIANVKPNYEGFSDAKGTRAKDLGAIHKQEDADAEKEIMEFFKDPDSELSNAYRDTIKEMMGFEIPEGLSPYQIQKATGINLANLGSQKIKQETEKIKSLAKAKEDARKELVKADAVDRAALFDIQKRIGGLMRGGKELKQQFGAINASNDLMKKLDESLSGNFVTTKPDGYDISTALSRAMSGGVPGQTLIELTMPQSFRGDVAEFKNYLSAQADNSIFTEAQLKHIKKGIEIIRESAKENLANTVRTGLGVYADLYKKYPKQEKLMREGFKGLIDDWDENGLPSVKGQTKKDSEKNEAKESSQDKGKTIEKKMYSPSRNQTKIIYSDGTEEVVDGKQ